MGQSTSWTPRNGRAFEAVLVGGAPADLQALNEGLTSRHIAIRQSFPWTAIAAGEKPPAGVDMVIVLLDGKGKQRDAARQRVRAYAEQHPDLRVFGTAGGLDGIKAVLAQHGVLASGSQQAVPALTAAEVVGHRSRPLQARQEASGGSLADERRALMAAVNEVAVRMLTAGAKSVSITSSGVNVQWLEPGEPSGSAEIRG